MHRLLAIPLTLLFACAPNSDPSTAFSEDHVDTLEICLVDSAIMRTNNGDPSDSSDAFVHAVLFDEPGAPYAVRIDTAPVLDPANVTVRGDLVFWPDGTSEYRERGGEVAYFSGEDAPPASADEATEAGLIAAWWFYSETSESDTLEMEREMERGPTPNAACGNQGNHAGCDLGRLEGTCIDRRWECGGPLGGGARGACCDQHDICTSEHCGAPDNPVVFDGGWQTYPCADFRKRNDPQCSAACRACHEAVRACFRRRRPPAGPSVCCAQGNCGAQQLCIINGAVITDAATCQGNAATAACVRTESGTGTGTGTGG